MRLAWGLVGMLLGAALAGATMGTGSPLAAAATPTDDDPRETTGPAWEVDRLEDGSYGFTWETTEPIGDAIVQARFSVSETTTCERQVEMAGLGDPDERLLRRAFLLQGETVGVWEDNAPSFSHVHAAGLDTRSSSGLVPFWAYQLTIEGPQAQDATLVAAGLDLQPWDNEFTGNVSLGLSIQCQAPFTVESLEGSDEVAFFDGRSLSGGAGASWGTNLEASAADGLAVNYEADTVSVVAAGHDEGSTSATQLAIAGPEHEETWRFIASPVDGGSFSEVLRGPPGTYEIDQHRLSGGADSAYWGAVYGHSPLEDAGQLQG